MDARHFDHLVRSLSEHGTRRGVLGLLAGLPVVGGLVALLGDAETDARGRRHRRRVKGHKHGKGRRRKHHKKKCKANSIAKTCAGTCGSVVNNCKKTVDCGPCACDPPCEVCFTCQDGPNTPGTCVVDPAQQGQDCGDPGQVCQADGSCACAAGSCANPTPICVDGTCVGCDETHPCPSGCCDASGECQDGTSTTACGDVGEQCIVCVVAGEVCKEGDCLCVSGVICSASGCCANASDVCTADLQCCAPVDPCTTGVCGAVSDNCGQSVTCDPCPVIIGFHATPSTIDRGADPPQTSDLFWVTSNATTCTYDDGTGPITVLCNGMGVIVGPAATTTYTLTASNATGAEVSAQTTVTVEYCHAISGVSGVCPSGATEFCRPQPIGATSSADAEAACNACATVACNNAQGTILGGSLWVNSGAGSFWYSSATQASPNCPPYAPPAGDHTDNGGCFLDRWAP